MTKNVIYYQIRLTLFISTLIYSFYPAFIFLKLNYLVNISTDNNYNKLKYALKILKIPG